MDNEPAFPVGVDVTQNQWKPSLGMSLRDYFAAKAMQGFAADTNATFSDGLLGMAKYAYKWADAMLEARK